MFRSFALDLVPGDTNAAWDIFVRDRETQTIERVSVDSNGAQANDDSGQFGFSISADGRFVVFFSTATNLVPGGSNGVGQIFLHDRSTGTTELISRSSTGVQGNARSSSRRSPMMAASSDSTATQATSSPMTSMGSPTCSCETGLSQNDLLSASRQAHPGNSVSRTGPRSPADGQ
ncbi:MAG: hypothetical protein IPJ19_21465 [Planctomycetes bacterium]|nr:hypothetical protein [Planctomycetota bacterium]